MKLTLLLTGLLFGQIDLPKPTVVPLPKPTPLVQSTAELTPDLICIGQFKTEQIVLTSPEGLLKVTPITGPLRQKGRWIDDPTKVKTKTLAGPFLYDFEPTGVGDVEIMFIPVGVKKAEEIVKQTIRANNGAQPPPQPPGPKPPQPDGTSPFAGEGLRCLIVYDPVDILPASQHSIIYGSQVRSYLNSKCPEGTAKNPDGSLLREWRFYPADVNTNAESPVWHNAMARKRDKLPWILVGNGKTGFEGPLPNTVEETLELLKKYGG